MSSPFIKRIAVVMLGMSLLWVSSDGRCSPPENSSLRTKDSPEQGDIVFGRLQVTFKEDADPIAARAQFLEIGIHLPANVLRSDHTMLATPHRDQAKLYGADLMKDPAVQNVDYTYTDDYLKQFHEKVEEDAAYLWITFKKPMTRIEVAGWLKKSHPDLTDVTLQASDFRVVVVDEISGQERSGGYPNPWKQALVQSVKVPEGQEGIYSRKISALSTVDEVDFVRVRGGPIKTSSLSDNK